MLNPVQAEGLQAIRAALAWQNAVPNGFDSYLSDAAWEQIGNAFWALVDAVASDDAAFDTVVSAQQLLADTDTTYVEAHDPMANAFWDAVEAALA